MLSLGLPQWLPLTDAEDLIARHLAAEAETMEEECLAGDLCDIPQSKLSAPQAGNGRLPPPEIELDLDCWQVGAAGP